MSAKDIVKAERMTAEAGESRGGWLKRQGEGGGKIKGWPQSDWSTFIWYLRRERFLGKRRVAWESRHSCRCGEKKGIAGSIMGGACHSD